MQQDRLETTRLVRWLSSVAAAALLMVLPQLAAAKKPPRASELRIEPKNVRVAESAGTAVLSVSRSKGTDGAVSVEVTTADGSATVGEDYLGVAITLEWADGEGGAKEVVVPILDDLVGEGDETVLVSLSEPSGNATLHPGHRTAVVRIRDNDADVPPDGACGECDGQVTELTLRYTGTSAAAIEVSQKIRGVRVVVFDEVVEPGETFTVRGQNGKGTLGSSIRVDVDGERNASFHTSCSEPIGPGLVRGDFEVVAGFSRNGGPLCPVADPEDPPPSGEDCGECDGQVTELTLQYFGAEAATVRVEQRIRGDWVVVFEDDLEPGDVFTVTGQSNKGTLGPFIRIAVDGARNAVIHTSCSEAIGPGLVAGDFEVVEGSSRNGGRLCPI